MKFANEINRIQATKLQREYADALNPRVAQAVPALRTPHRTMPGIVRQV